MEKLRQLTYHYGVYLQIKDIYCAVTNVYEPKAFYRYTLKCKTTSLHISNKRDFQHLILHTDKT